MKILVPEKVNYIIDVLTGHGYEAYAVGGCVRDVLLGRTPDDWDITTSAAPQEVKELFRRTIDTGIAHGTVTVMLEKEGFEVTTYRIDGEYEDSRHPKNVEFTSSLEEDLKRRDFTINAMAYNEAEGIVDKFQGMEDIRKEVIRCVGKAEDRFDEDALRILRAVRFSAQLGFLVEEKTREAIIKKAGNLIHISAERIRTELNKLLLSAHPERLFFAYETGITKIIFPEFDRMMETEQQNPHHIYDVGRHTVKAIEVLEKKTTILCFTMLLHDVGKPDTKTIDEKGIGHFYGHPEQSALMAEEILKRLKFDNNTIDSVVRLVKWHDYEFRLTPAGMRRAANKIGGDIIEDLFLVKEADILAQSPEMQREKLEKLKKAMMIYEEIKKSGECISLKDLAVSGKDLINYGFRPGKEMGEILRQLLELVIETPELNEKERLLEIACKNYKQTD